VGRGSAPDPRRAGGTAALSAFLDTNVVIRHLTGDPPELAGRATAALAAAEELLLADLVVAECVYVLESFYEVSRERVAELMRAAIALPSIKTIDSPTLLRALEVYELERLDFAEAYLVAQAEVTGVGTVLSFDKSIDRVGTVKQRAAGGCHTAGDRAGSIFDDRTDP
jgi:predicted nucleic-acid-binding protein